MSVNVDELVAAARAKYLEALPEFLRNLGEIVRQTVVDGDLGPLAQFLRELDVAVPEAALEQFRDVLILNRLDLKDLEPAARERLRARVIADQDPAMMSPDYKAAVEAGTVPKCRGCRHFVRAPKDGTPQGEKACVEFGTKGADDACFGFTRSD